MPGAVAEKEVCWNCGAEMRPDTQFCYNCGESLEGPASDDNSKPTKTDNGLADLEKALAAEFPPAEESKLDQAARERRQARRRAKKELKIVWEPVDGTTDRVYLLFAIMIFVFAAAIVFITFLSR